MKSNKSRNMKNARYYRFILSDKIIALRNLAELYADCEPKIVHVEKYYTNKGFVNADMFAIRLRMTMADFNTLKCGLNLVDLKSRNKKILGSC